jgi:acyl CoA:acetate/3-ketoacid CoA transferase beta subunit
MRENVSPARPAAVTTVRIAAACVTAVIVKLTVFDKRREERLRSYQILNLVLPAELVQTTGVQQ